MVAVPVVDLGGADEPRDHRRQAGGAERAQELAGGQVGQHQVGRGSAERTVGEDDLGRIDIARPNPGGAQRRRQEARREPFAAADDEVARPRRQLLEHGQAGEQPLELVHRTPDLGRDLLGAPPGRAPEDLEVAGAEIVDLLRGARAVAGRRPLGEPEQRIGHPGGRRHDDDAWRGPRLDDLHDPPKRSRICQRRAAELVNLDAQLPGVRKDLLRAHVGRRCIRIAWGRASSAGPSPSREARNPSGVPTTIDPAEPSPGSG